MEILKITPRDIQEKKGKNGPYWTIMTTDEKYGTFEKEVADKLKVGQEISVEVVTNKGYKNIKSVVDEETHKTYEKYAAPSFKDNKTTTMYVSYAKDVFIGLLEARKIEQMDIPADEIMKVAVLLVKQAKEAF